MRSSKGFQRVVEEFLLQCKKREKKKLIIDVRDIDGGNRYLADDTFKQLLTSLVPYSGSRIPASDAATVLGKIASAVDTSLEELKCEIPYFSEFVYISFLIHTSFFSKSTFAMSQRR